MKMGGARLTDDYPEVRLTITEAYDAMVEFLRIYWDIQGKPENEIIWLLSRIIRNSKLDLLPGDAAFWGDWVQAVSIVQSRRPDSAS